MALGQSMYELSAGIRLVVFDVDGTLYDQRRLRRRMALELLKHLAWSSTGRRKIHILQTFRRIRETLADQEAEHVTVRQYEDPAAELKISAEEVRAVTDEWIERRPLPLLADCAEPGIAQLFRELRRAGRTIAVLSDYPAADKLAALDLTADVIVSASDPEVNRFKPHPRGLEVILESTRVPPAQTVLIGDRMERDGLCAQRCGVRFLLKGVDASGATESFRHYTDLAPVLIGHEDPTAHGNYR